MWFFEKNTEFLCIRNCFALETPQNRAIVYLRLVLHKLRFQTKLVAGLVPSICQSKTQQRIHKSPFLGFGERDSSYCAAKVAVQDAI